MTALVLASDRGPVTFVERAGTLHAARRPGSVTEILDTAARATGRPVHWFAASAAPGDRAGAGAGAVADAAAGELGYRFEPIPVEPEEYRAYYEQAGARVLWPALHDLWDELPGTTGAPGPGAFAAYRRVNQRFARRIADAAPAGTPVWFHDYQVALAPRALRELRADLPVGMFLHTPFVAPDAASRLPEAVLPALLEGMLGADLLGFQRRRWAQRFLDCAALAGATVDRATGSVRHGGRRAWVRCYPTPVDPASLRSLGEQARRSVPVERLGVPDGTERLVVRVDRLDPAKNLVRGFEAYGLLLDRHPGWRGRVHMVACVVPSREAVPEYRWYGERVRAAADRVQERHPGSLTVLRGQDRPRALAALARYDVLLVNALLDGMNLVAQEGPLLNTADGVLVLSDGAGAADLLGAGTVRLDRPRDVPATADALHAALSMQPAARRRNAATLRSVLLGRSPARWLADQVADLESVAAGRPPVTGW